MLYNRLISVKVRLAKEYPISDFRGSLEIDKLRMVFNVYKSEGWAANKATLNIYNLGQSKRNEFSFFGDEVRIFAGYQNAGGTQLLYVGNTTQVTHTFSEPEIITSIEAGDGDKNLNNIIVKVSFSANVSIRTVIQAIAQQLNFSIVEFAFTEDLTYSNGFSEIGIGKTILDKACKALNLDWSVQNNNLVILRKDGVSQNRPITEINADTGMIGTPERYIDKKNLTLNARFQNSWRVKTLLRPDILPGDRVRLRSQRVNLDGDFVVTGILHQGDNFGSIFQSTLEITNI